VDRTILHVDANCFYASVECCKNPELKGKPVAVVGDAKKRHGIILTANYVAKAKGVKTGEAIFEAKRKCPSLICVGADMSEYIKYSKRLKNIILRYTDMVENFGIDEAWADVTASKRIFGSGEEIAKSISDAVKTEIGITVSVGVSFNKVFAKLGSDMKKPDGITVITRDNFRDKVWCLPVSDLLYIGRKTTQKLNLKNIKTIGELANTKRELLCSWFGKNGEMLYDYANGYECSPVRLWEDEILVKSVGNSTTTPRDLENNEDVKMVLYVLCDSVARRLREQELFGKTVSIYIKTNQMSGFCRQCTIDCYTNTEREIFDAAYSLFKKSYSWNLPVRALGVAVSELSRKTGSVQLDIYGVEEKRENTKKLEKVQDELRMRFGNFCVRRGILMKDNELTMFDPKHTHTVHPVSTINTR